MWSRENETREWEDVKLQKWRDKKTWSQWCFHCVQNLKWMLKSELNVVKLKLCSYLIVLAERGWIYHEMSKDWQEIIQWIIQSLIKQIYRLHSICCVCYLQSSVFMFNGFWVLFLKWNQWTLMIQLKEFGSENHCSNYNKLKTAVHLEHISQRRKGKVFSSSCAASNWRDFLCKRITPLFYN